MSIFAARYYAEPQGCQNEQDTDLEFKEHLSSILDLCTCIIGIALLGYHYTWIFRLYFAMSLYNITDYSLWVEFPL